MDPFDRFFRRPLEDVLVTQGIVSREKATELLESAKASDEPFAVALLDSGTLTPWDLAKTISTHYQMPVHPIPGFKLEKVLLEGLRSDMLHRHQVLPVGRFGSTRTFAVIEPPGRALVEELQAVCGGAIFFFVAEAPEVRRALEENVHLEPAVAKEGGTGWQSIFDSAEQAVMKGLGRKSEE
jgi:hypothetical protein